MGGGGNKSDDLIPVTLLCGFLGSGKTTLLKHVLETKHEEEDFKCAVIVNDMAELNIDKSLIDQTSLIQSDEAMVGMHNGCICCTLQNDLVEQIISLTQKKKFNYILIEASGVSEPHEIAPLFEVAEDNHDQCDLDGADTEDHDHSKPQLGEVARLDTCVTLIDSADFYNNLGSMKAYDQCEVVGTIAELMMDQVEFANVVILNKGDLVDKKQKADLIKKVSIMNPNAKIMNSVQSKINVKDILNTKLYKDKEEFWVTSTKHADAAEKMEKAGRKVPEACTARFDINSFVYRARRPFHPSRLNDLFMEPFFMIPSYASCKHKDDEEKKLLQEEDDLELQKVQKEANVKQKKRTNMMGELLRSKGFIWMATSHEMMGGWQQAGNILRILPENPWLCLTPEQWEGTGVEDLVLKDIRQENGEDWQYKDRRQEIVFIGHKMKKDTIQNILDKCLLTDEEMSLGPEGWKETMEDLDNIQFFLEDGDLDDEDEEDMMDENDEKENLEKPDAHESKRRGKKRKNEDEHSVMRYNLRKRKD